MGHYQGMPQTWTIPDFYVRFWDFARFILQYWYWDWEFKVATFDTRLRLIPESPIILRLTRRLEVLKHQYRHWDWDQPVSLHWDRIDSTMLAKFKFMPCWSCRRPSSFSCHPPGWSWAGRPECRPGPAARGWRWANPCCTPRTRSRSSTWTGSCAAHPWPRRSTSCNSNPWPIGKNKHCLERKIQS